MSMDFKVLECTTDNLDNNNLDWNFLDYINIRSDDYDCFHKIYNSDIAKRFEESNDGYDDFRTFKSVVYDKETLLNLINENKCPLQEQLKEIIIQSQYDYIILQLF